MDGITLPKVKFSGVCVGGPLHGRKHEADRRVVLYVWHDKVADVLVQVVYEWNGTVWRFLA